jgi:hypothetical protein
MVGMESGSGICGKGKDREQPPKARQELFSKKKPPRENSRGGYSLAA